MKFAVAILAVLAVASPLSALQLPASGSGALAKEIQYVFDLVPLDKLVPILMSYAANETDVHAALKILQSNEFKLLVQDVEAIPEVKTMMKYVHEAGLDINTLKDKLTDNLDLDHISPLEASADADTIPELKSLLKYVQEAGVANITLQKRLNDFLDLEHVSPLANSEDAECGGFSRFAIAFRNLVPVWKYEQRFQEKFQNSDVYSDFIRKCNKLELEKIYLSFRSNEHYAKVVQEAQQAGIFSAECRGYYPLLMAAKVVLALAL
ncbi:uncharacterized protein LOC143368243 [Andrena cerasifolii]|uniref:uncharacterized protein LOC143368243 n=1 Tax=Andrena cerasifolii TaxID=2819439 RepID=UPI00403770B5